MTDQVLLTPVTVGELIITTPVAVSDLVVGDAPVNAIFGVPGPIGSSWYTGSTTPDSGLGLQKDFYLRTTNGDYYEKTGVSTWTLRGNLKGPQVISTDANNQAILGTDSYIYVPHDSTKSDTTHLHTGVYDPIGTAAAAVSAHISSADPHADRSWATGQFVPLSSLDQINGTAVLDSGRKIAIARLPQGANGVAVLDGSGLIPTGNLPPLAINEITVVATEAAMLALTAQRGDVAVRSDTGKTYILSADTPTVLNAWKEILAAGQVTAVNGQSGVVSLGVSDITGLVSALSGKSDTTHAHSGVYEANGAVATHAAVTTSVHGISNTANLVYTSDSRLTDSRTPTAHASTHAVAGSDPITIAESQVTNLTTDLSDLGTRISTLETTGGTTGSSTYALVRNATGSTLTKGTVVYTSGSNGDHVQVSKALATSDATSARTLGFVSANILNGADGYVLTEGYLTGIDTSGKTSGDIVYLDGTTAGTWTTTKPVAPLHMVYLGVVTRVNPNNGSIYVKVQNGYELDEIHDVLITSKTNGDLLQYESSTGLWKNKAQSTLTVTESQVTNLVTDLAGKVGTSDSRLTDARTPTTHAASHATGGTDAITISESQVTNLVTDLSGKAATSHSHTQFIPVGGTTGQVLSKINGTDYNSQWVDQSIGTPNPLLDTYLFSTNTTIDNPGSGFFRLNNATGSLVTKMAFADVSNSTSNNYEYFSRVKTGDTVMYTPAATPTGSKWWRASVNKATRIPITNSVLSQRTTLPEVWQDSSFAGTTGSSKTTASIAYLAGDLVLVDVYSYGEFGLVNNTPTMTGATFTLIQTKLRADGVTRISSYYAYISSALSSGAITVSCSVTPGSAYAGVSASVAVVTGANPSNPIGAKVTGFATLAGSNTTTAITTTFANSYVYLAGNIVGTDAFSAPANLVPTSSTQTLRATIQNIGSIYGFKSVATSGTSTTTNITGTDIPDGGGGPYSVYEVVPYTTIPVAYWTFDVSNVTVGSGGLPSASDVCNINIIPSAPSTSAAMAIVLGG